jgi:hypothetical protein
MIEKEWLHAPPEPGQAVSPCCGRTVNQFPPYDRIVLDPSRVTCGRLSDSEITLLSGQPVVADPDHDQVVFTMATAVAGLSSGTVGLQAAHEAVTAAMMELLPSGYVLTRWPVSLMINVTSRAQELSGTSRA